jgi:hypothetical protein
MGMKRTWERAAKGLALLALAAVVPACSDDDNSGSPSTSGAGADTPLNWNASYGSTGDTSTTTATGDTPLLWTDPNAYPDYVPVTIGSIIRFTDERTYTSSNTYLRPDRPFAYHPLETSTTTQSILIAEDNLSGQINSLRSASYGVGGGAGGIGGGIVIGNTNGIFLPMHGTARDVNRAHCHHYSGYHPTSPFPWQNEMGDWFGTNDQTTITHFYPPGIENYWWEAFPAGLGGTGPAPGTVTLDYPQGVPTMPTWQGGRLGRSAVYLGRNSPWSWSDHLFVGTNYDSYTDVYNELLADPNHYYWINAAPGWWTHIAVGRWVGGPQTYYWEVSFLWNPDPAY